MAGLALSAADLQTKVSIYVEHLEQYRSENCLLQLLSKGVVFFATASVAGKHRLCSLEAFPLPHDTERSPVERLHRFAWM